jgi:hypothetical protein
MAPDGEKVKSDAGAGMVNQFFFLSLSNIFGTRETEKGEWMIRDVSVSLRKSSMMGEAKRWE